MRDAYPSMGDSYEKKAKNIDLRAYFLSLLLILGCFSILSKVTRDSENYQELNEGWHVEINDQVYENVTLEHPDLNLSAVYGYCSHSENRDLNARQVYRKADTAMYDMKVVMKSTRED